MKLEEVSRAVSHALRHEPEKYGLTLDSQGWVEIDDLLAGLKRQGPAWDSVDRQVLGEMMATAKKQRHEVSGSRIRAYYGHSVDKPIDRPNSQPPELLFHGTSPEAWETIRARGLKPMNRQSVHLSADRATALQVGKRKSNAPVILVINAAGAHAAGVAFALGNETVWLADAVPAKFIRLDS